MELNTLGIYFLVLFLVVTFCAERFKKTLRSSEQSMTLKEGETFVGVIERGRGQYVFIGHDLQRYQESLTLEEMKLIKEEFYKGYE